MAKDQDDPTREGAGERDAEAAAIRNRIEEANRALAGAQRTRLNILLRSCLPAYHKQAELHAVSFNGEPFTLNPETLSFVAGILEDDAFADSEKADELAWWAERFATQLRLRRKLINSDFDVFLCHSSEDKREVQSIREQLKRRGLLPWLDESELPPGTPWLKKLQDDIAKVKSVAVIVGRSGIGPWQSLEIESAIRRFVEKGTSVIPTILPSCKAPPELPDFLRSFGWVDYRTLDPDPLEQLIWGIRGKRAV